MLDLYYLTINIFDYRRLILLAIKGYIISSKWYIYKENLNKILFYYIINI